MMQPLAQPLGAVDTMIKDVTLDVAGHQEPFHGRAAVAYILSAVLDGPWNDLQIGETIEGRDRAMLMLELAR